MEPVVSTLDQRYSPLPFFRQRPVLQRTRITKYSVVMVQVTFGPFPPGGISVASKTTG